MTSHFSTNGSPPARNPWLAAVLAFLFGPFGLLYSSIVLSISEFILGSIIYIGVFALTDNDVIAFLVVNPIFAIAAFFIVKYKNAKYMNAPIYGFDNPTLLKAFIVGILGFSYLWLIGANVVNIISDTKYTMRPTFNGYGRRLVLKTSFLRGNIQRGQVIIYKRPGDRPFKVMIRVAALSGDTVEMKGGLLYVNGQPGDAPQLLKNLKSSPSCLNANADVNKSNLAILGFGGLEEAKKLIIPKDYIYVLADNRGENVEDSRIFGAVPVESIIGVVKIPNNSPADVDCSFQ